MTPCRPVVVVVVVTETDDTDKNGARHAPLDES